MPENTSVIETFTRGKLKNSDYSEDRIVCSRNAIGVIDGSRGPDYRETDMVAEFLASAVRTVEDIDSETRLEDLVGRLTGLVRTAKQARKVSDFETTGAFVFCIYAVDRREIWRLGDCLFAINGTVNENPCKPEVFCAEARARLITAWLEMGRTPDAIMADPSYHSVIDPLFKAECRLMNDVGSGLGLGVVDGTPVPVEFIECHAVEPDAMLEICSDGYSRPMGTLEATETELHRLLDVDPLCIKENLGAKGFAPDRVSYDDRSYIRFKT